MEPHVFTCFKNGFLQKTVKSPVWSSVIVAVLVTLVFFIYQRANKDPKEIQGYLIIFGTTLVLSVIMQLIKPKKNDIPTIKLENNLQPRSN